MTTTDLEPKRLVVPPTPQPDLCLDPEARQTLTYLLDVLHAPTDRPHLLRVVTAAKDAINHYAQTLASPSATLTLIQAKVGELAAQLEAPRGNNNRQSELEFSLYRRLLQYPGYALCLSLYQTQSPDIDLASCATGLAIAYAIATGKRVEARYANAIRRTLIPAQFGSPSGAQVDHTQWHKIYQKKRIEASKLLEAGTSPDPGGMSSERLFDLAARYELQRKTRYSPPRQRQAILDRRHQPKAQLLRSAASLLTLASDGDHSALLLMIAFCAGISLRSTRDMPLADQVDDDDWLMVLDVDAGLIKTNLAHLTPNAARPPRDTTCFRTANKIIVKPLPSSVATLLKTQRLTHPEAATVGVLLPESSIASRQLTLPYCESALAPSAARFLAAAGPFAVNNGIDRLTAATLVNDYALVPASKLYYCRVRREEIWDASKHLYAALGWGNAVPLVPGLPVGSCIVPTREALAAWYAWMANTIQTLNPGRHTSLARLFEHHNAYARVCASLAVLCLAGREVQEFRFTTDNLSPDVDYCSFNDKWVGICPGNLDVPINALLREQLRYWYAHCRALHRRLTKRSTPAAETLRETLARFLAGDTLPLFFEIDGRNRFRPLGSKALSSWWPESLRFSTDFGRHFWEVELRDAGLSSSRIDLLMRHVTHGVESHCSTHDDAMADIRIAIVTAQESVLTQLGMRAIPGLSTHC